VPRLDLGTALHRPPVHEWLGPNQDARSVISRQSPILYGLGPRAFVRRIQRAPLPQCSNEGQGKGKAKHQDQDEGPSMQRGKKNKKDHRRPANSVLVATADHTGKQPSKAFRTTPTSSNTSTRTACSSSAFCDRPAGPRKEKANKQRPRKGA